MAQRGVDISSYQPSVDFAKLATERQFVIVKSSEGTGYKNPFYDKHIDAAKAAKLITGAYHFARPDIGLPEVQASYFWNCAGPKKPDILALDLEAGAGDLTAWTVRFLQKLEQLSGYDPSRIYLYSAAWFYGPHVQPDARLTRWRLWWAAYQSSQPATPKPWSQIHIWQNSDKDIVPGIPGAVDGDIALVSLLVGGVVPFVVPAGEDMSLPLAQAIIWLFRLQLFGPKGLSEPDAAGVNQAQAAIDAYAKRMAAGENPEGVLSSMLSDAQRDGRLNPAYKL